MRSTGVAFKLSYKVKRLPDKTGSKVSITSAQYLLPSKGLNAHIQYVL